MEYLLDHGASVNDPGGVHCNGTTSLMDAAVNGHVDIVSLLIRRNANVTLKNTKVTKSRNVSQCPANTTVFDCCRSLHVYLDFA